MSSSKFRQYAKIVFIGGVGLPMVIGEQHPHIEQSTVRGAIFEPVVAGTSSSWTTYTGTGTTSGR
jgi:hypothetical protein